MMRNLVAQITWNPAIALKVKNDQYDLCTKDGLAVLHQTWDSIRRPGITLTLVTWSPVPPYGPPRPPLYPPPPPPPVIIHTIAKQREVEMKEAYHEMVELLDLAKEWTADKETVKSGLGDLLGIWTNAPDPHTEDSSDYGSFMTDSSTSSSSSSSDIAD
ncbi:hypothetical protein IL306_011108 [Fusarium sp. DS 682]|nr:hypothetical protein IL306_011108 [Fusarium sp. DS 682]